jgi:broad specificity phosphatase PhoE
MTTFYLIRHGDKTDSDTMVGRAPGVHLTAQGRLQAKRVARHLRFAAIERIFSSPLERAVETVQPLAKAKGLPIESSLAFHEIDMGAWTGVPMKRLNAIPSWRRFCRFHGGTSIPHGETLAEAQARMVSQMIRLHEEHPRKGIAIATHEDPIRLAVCFFIGAPIEVYEHLTIRLGSVTVLTLDAERAIVERMDEVPEGRPPGKPSGAKR